MRHRNAHRHVSYSKPVEYKINLKKKKKKKKGPSNINSRGEGTPRKIGWGCAARFPKPLSRSAIFPSLFMTWPKIRNPILWPDSYTRFQCYVHRRHRRFDMPSFDRLCNLAHIKLLTQQTLSRSNSTFSHKRWIISHQTKVPSIKKPFLDCFECLHLSKLTA